MSKLKVPDGYVALDNDRGCLMYALTFTYVGPAPFVFYPVPDGPNLLQLQINKDGEYTIVTMFVRFRDRNHRNKWFRAVRGK